MKRLRFIALFTFMVFLFSMSTACGQGNNTATLPNNSPTTRENPDRRTLGQASNSNLLNGGCVAQKRKVIVKGVLQLNLENGWIYYSRFENETYAIYKIKVDGSGQTKVSDDDAYSILVEDGWIYFFPESAGGGIGSSNPVLYRMKTDGTARSRVGQYGVVSIYPVTGSTMVMKTRSASSGPTVPV